MKIEIDLGVTQVVVERGYSHPVDMSKMSKDQVMRALEGGVARFLQNALIEERKAKAITPEVVDAKWEAWLNGTLGTKRSRSGLTTEEREIFVDLLEASGVKDARTMKATELREQWSALDEDAHEYVRAEARKLVTHKAARREKLAKLVDIRVKPNKPTQLGNHPKGGWSKG